jgi:putative pyruvate formate lyase activating enzyme
MGCVFCQNAEISTASFSGKILTPKALSNLFFQLVDQGAHNINLVNPTHFAPAIGEALSLRKLPVPVVYNSGGYDKVETLKGLEGLIDIYLPDFKYSRNETALRYSHAPHYVETALSAIGEMVRQCGAAVFSEDGMMEKGVLVRHLILPGKTNQSIEALRLLKDHFNQQILVSLMAQYIPCGSVSETCFPELNRPITKRELCKVEDALFDLELDGFVQERSAAAKDYIPPFDLTGL